jgi:lysophospholipase L1-like esterase
LRISISPFIFGVFLLSAGCSALGLGSDDGPTAPSGPPAAGSTIKYSAIGASDANGVGSSVPCAPFTTCIGGKGYVQVTERELIARGYTVELMNLGIPTAAISRRFQALGQQYGETVLTNYLESELPFVQPGATLVTVFAGPNDANIIRTAISRGAAGSDVNGYIDQQVRAFAEDIQALVDGIRAATSSGRIVVLNVPNLGTLPYLAGSSAADRRAAQRIAAGMTTTGVNPLTSRNARVIDLMCDTRMYQPSTFSSDGFHPSDAGYAMLAAEIVRALTSTSYPLPATSCSQMTLVP